MREWGSSSAVVGEGRLKDRVGRGGIGDLFSRQLVRTFAFQQLNYEILKAVIHFAHSVPSFQWLRIVGTYPRVLILQSIVIGVFGC